jgi:hypothetical protein
MPRAEPLAVDFAQVKILAHHLGQGEPWMA